MAKLKYDRPINISARSSSRVQIPNDEVWKVTTSPHNSNVDAFIKLYGGGTVSTSKIQMELYPASPSSTSKSKRVHGGGAPWLENLFSIERFGSLKNEMRKLWSQTTSCGKWVSEIVAPLRLTCKIRILVVLARSELLVEAPRSNCRAIQCSRVSLLKSSNNRAAEGVTLYA